MIVSKFGGSTLLCSNGVKNISRLARLKKRKVLVFSAVGKGCGFAECNNKSCLCKPFGRARGKKNKECANSCFSDCCKEKLTDILIDFSNASEQTTRSKLLNKIKAKFMLLLYLTGVKFNLAYYLRQIKNSRDRAFIISRGEYITALIMSKYLNIPFVAAERLFVFSGDKINECKTRARLRLALKKYGRFCTSGFYGVQEVDGKITLFERGGGDTSGAIISRQLRAKTYEKWTDIDGVKVTNFSKLANPKTISRISYADMELYSDFGANVFSKNASDILRESCVKTKIGSVIKPRTKKTVITKKAKNVNFIGVKICGNEAKILVKTHNKNFIKNYAQNAASETICFTVSKSELNTKVSEIYRVLFKNNLAAKIYCGKKEIL